MYKNTIWGLTNLGAWNFIQLQQVVNQQQATIAAQQRALGALRAEVEQLKLLQPQTKIDALPVR